MAGCLNKKQISCLVAGICCVVAVISFAVWAGFEGLFDNLYPQPINKNASEAERVAPIKDRRGFIFSRSPEHPESVRIIASIATSKPVAIRPLVSGHPPTDRLEPAIRNPRQNYFKQPLESIDWNEESLNINRLHSAISRVFGVHVPADGNHAIMAADSLSNWMALSYLSLGIFLLRQMDHQLMTPARQSTTAVNNPWTYNSLNLLFSEPGRVNVTDIERLIDNQLVIETDSSSDYMWAAHNILRASEDSHGIDCIWAAYCVELDRRASVQSATGTVARMNGVVLKTITGLLKPSMAVVKFLRSAFEWDGMDCHHLFPRCRPEEAVNYLIRLATANDTLNSLKN